jgi:hypothetical protein
VDRFVIQKTGFDKEDIRQAVVIHRGEISQGFLSSLGEKALGPIFSLASEGPTGVLLVARDVEQQHACGFVLGAVDTRRFYMDFLLKKSLTTAIALGRLLSHEFCNGMRQKGIDTFRVATGESLVHAQRFYEKLGAKKVASIQVHQGQKSIIYIYETRQAAQGSRVSQTPLQ